MLQTNSESGDRPQAAVAILYSDDEFLLQLRDDHPHILYPGHWAFFGGHLEPGEIPETAVQRELLEEINYQPPTLRHLRSDLGDAQIIRHVFYAPLVVPIAALDLREGMDLGLASLDAIQQGQHYSQRLGEFRPISRPHQQILLDFIQSGKKQALLDL